MAVTVASMPGPRAYNVMYRFGAPWEIGPREELVETVRSGRLTPSVLAPGRAIDLGCGSGANAIFLADHGFDVVGVDFSRVALEKARMAATSKPGRRVRFVRGDLTATAIPDVPGPFDLLVDYGTLDDLKGEKRRLMAATVKRLARPGAVFLMWCFHAAKKDLPLMSFKGASRMLPAIAPGEERALFADAFDIERLPKPEPGSRAACFLMTRR